MAASGLIGKGVILEYGTAAGTYGSKIANMLDCNVPEWSCDIIDVTHNDSATTPNREKLPGLFDNGTFSGTFNYDHTEYLEAHSIKGVQKFWQLTLSNTKTIRFSAFISKISSPVPMADKITFDLDITIDTGTLTIAAA